MTKIYPGTTEYDRFGPWIDEVHKPDDVPRLYRSHPIDFDSERLVLKVPRNISRRNASPDMDLYDHLIIAGADALTVLSRRINTDSESLATAASASHDAPYDQTVIPFGDIVSIRDALNLLDGHLEVSTATGTPVHVRYNGSGGPAIASLVGVLREVVCTKPPSVVGAALLASGSHLARPAMPRGKGQVDTFLASAFLDAHGANPRLSAWAAHGHRRLAPEAPGSRGTLERFKHALSPMTLHGALFAADDVALEVFGRHLWLIRGRAAIYSTARLVIPFSSPDRLDMAPHPLYPGVTVATIGSGAWSAELPVPDDSVAAEMLSEVAAKVG